MSFVEFLTLFAINFFAVGLPIGVAVYLGFLAAVRVITRVIRELWGKP